MSCLDPRSLWDTLSTRGTRLRQKRMRLCSLLSIVAAWYLRTLAYALNSLLAPRNLLTSVWNFSVPNLWLAARFPNNWEIVTYPATVFASTFYLLTFSQYAVYLLLTHWTNSLLWARKVFIFSLSIYISSFFFLALSILASQPNLGVSNSHPNLK